MEDPSTVTVMVLLSVFSLCGTIGNSLVLYIYTNKKEKSTAGIFIMSLAGTDLFTCLFIMPYTEVAIYLQYKLHFDVACKVYMFFITCNIPFAAFIMVAIATDRYFCICHPFLHALNIRRAKIIVVCLLAAASSFGVITALMCGVYIPSALLQNAQGTNMSHTPSLQRFNNSDIPLNRTLSLSASYLNTNYTGIGINDNNTMNDVIENCAQNSTCHRQELLNTSFKHDSSDTENYIFTGLCQPNFIIVDSTFVDRYQKVYACTYLLSFFAVVVLYGLIYKSIHEHRAKRSKRKRSSLYPSGVEFSTVETQFTAVTHVNPHKRNGRDNGSLATGPEMQPMRPKLRNNTKAISIKEKTLIANIRTAAMLFVVTIVFLIAFFPAWLMAHRLLDYNQVIFYMYFVYNTANPFIYAFMNKSFRDDLGKVLKCQSMPLVR